VAVQLITKAVVLFVIIVDIQNVASKMVINFTGDGKGKTSAALGIALRASGWGQRVAFLQFIKGYKEVGEIKATKKIDQIEIFQYLDDRQIGIDKPRANHQRSIPRVLKHFREILESKKYDLVVLDEINNAVEYGLLKEESIIPLIKKHSEIDFVLTGRKASRKLLAIADLVTEMRKVKHPFDKKIPAKKGIDF